MSDPYLPPQSALVVAAPTALTNDDKTMAAVAHGLGVVTGFLGPALIYLAYNGRSKFVEFHALQSLAIQIISTVVLIAITLLTCGIGAILALPLIPLIMGLEAWHAYRAYNGEWAAYPLLEKIGADKLPDAG